MVKTKENKITIRAMITVLWFIALAYGIYSGYNYSIDNLGFKPTQPVAFSHKAHAQKYNMKCLYCHTTAEKSGYSALPTTYTCMVCHIALKTETKLMQPVISSYDNNIPINWVSVYKLPDYTRFEHSRHLRALIDCSSCHGKVEEMDSLYQVTAITMGWCLNCHREPEKYIIPARPISGIFITDSLSKILKDNKIKLAQPMTYRLNQYFSDYNDSAAITQPAYGIYETGLPKPFYSFIPMPKLPGKGPESCSSCHH